MTTEIQQLLASGSEVTFLDGSTVNLVLSARSMARIEDRYGSLDTYVKALNVGSGGDIFHLLAFTFQIALGLPNEDRAWDLIDTRESDHYLQAISNALTEALPKRGAENPPTAPVDLSPGADSSPSQSSNGALTPAVSGT